nr:hypothetical protein [Lysinibacillus timonensis]
MKAQKITLYWLLALIYLSFIGLQLGRIQAITDFNYTLHEILYLPFNLSVFVVPVLFMLYIFLVIKYLLIRGKIKLNLNTFVQTVLIFTSFIIIISITEYQFHEVTTSGVFKVEQKLYEDREYYLKIDGKKIEVSQNEFHLIEENQSYLISFTWNKRSPENGKIEMIEPID